MAKGIILGQEQNIDDKLQEVNNKFNNYLPLSGGTMNGEINMSNKKITNLPNPSSGTDACNLQTVQSRINSALAGQSSSLSWKRLGSTYISSATSGKFTYNLSTIPFAMGVNIVGRFQTMSRSPAYIYINLNNSNANNDTPIISAGSYDFQNKNFDVSRMLVPSYISVNGSGSSFTYHYIDNSDALVIGTNTFGVSVNYGTFTGYVYLYALM